MAGGQKGKRQTGGKGGKGKGKARQGADRGRGGEYDDGLGEMMVLKRGKEEDEIMSRYMVGGKKK